MAKDTADLLRSLNVSNADFIGWSDGGILALLIARNNPELVHRLVASGANTRLVGMSPDEIKKIQDKIASLGYSGIKVNVGVGVGVVVIVSVGVLVGVSVGVLVGVSVFVGVKVGVLVGVCVGVCLTSIIV